MSPTEQPFSAWRRLGPYARRQRGAWSLAGLGLAAATLATSTALSQIRPLVDEALPASLEPATRAAGLQQTLTLVVTMLALTGLGVVLMRQASVLIARLAQRLTADLRGDYFASLLRQPPAFYRDREFGRLINAGLTDTETIGVFLTQAVPFVLVSLGQLVLAMLFMVSLNWALALICFGLVGGLQLWSLRGLVPRMQQLEADYRAQLGAVTSRLNEALLGVRDIQIFVQEARVTQAYRAQLDQLAALMTRNMGLSTTNFAVSYAMTGLGLAVIYGGGLLLLINAPALFGGHAEAGHLASFAAFFTQFTAPLSALSGAWLRAQGLRVAAQRVFALLDQPPAIREAPGALDPGRLRGHLRFENVSFSYAPDDPEAWRVKNVSLDIPPGQKVALVGGSGSGKSTLLNLVARFADVTAGRVTIDGHDVRTLSLTGLRANLGLVAQNFTLFRGTLAENIRFGRPEAGAEAVRAAAAVGAVTEFLDQLEAGLETPLGELGQGLSGGQKQRVGIARAALTAPAILLLDEATSALDAESEAAVTRALDTLSRGRTVLVIAHRLNTIRNADQIVVLGTDARGDGVVRASGDHDTLLETCPEYADLWGRQRRKAILLPLGPFYDTTPALPTALGLAAAFKAPLFLLDFGPVKTQTADEVVDKRFGVSVPIATSDPRIINARHLGRVQEIERRVRGEGLELTVVRPPREDVDWVTATLDVIAQVEASHLVAVDNVLVPMEKLRESIRLIERKGGVEYILVNPIAGVE
ncbi:MAG: ABC transporter ATP-binding protein [Anaerolineales bacterium]|nr:ABC transporter ATP-binding protein [Anaerolineales bacterium]